jgi:hypothetical protein
MCTNDPERTRVQRTAEMRLDSSGSFQEPLRAVAVPLASDDKGVFEN